MRDEKWIDSAENVDENVIKEINKREFDSMYESYGGRYRGPGGSRNPMHHTWTYYLGLSLAPLAIILLAFWPYIKEYICTEDKKTAVTVSVSDVSCEE